MKDLAEVIALSEAKLKASLVLKEEIKTIKNQIIASCDFIYDLTQANKRLLS